MLCPEVFNFKAPDSSFNIQKTASNEHVLKKIKQLQFPHLVSVILPDILKIPEIITKTFSSNSKYYKITNLLLSELIAKPFISCFVKQGTLSLLSINTRLDCDNSVAVTTEGHLVLNLDKQSYQSSGLDGKPSHFYYKTKERFVVTIDLKLDLLKGKKVFDRIKKCLGQLGRFTVILRWEPPVVNPEICPSSIAKYFADQDCDVSYSELTYNMDTLYSIKVPNVNFKDYLEEDILGFSEWLGMVCIHGEMERDPSDDYLSSYQVPEPNRILGQVKVLQWKGLFSHQQINTLYQILRKFAQQEEKEWIALYVQGISDAAVSWNNDEHHYYTSGDNSYLVVFDKENCILCTNECSKKQYK